MNQKHPQLPMADQSQQEMEELELQTRMERIGQKLLVLSGKGGVGKSTVAANLAMSLALAGKKVGLLDVDLHGPSIPGILGLGEKRLGPDGTGGIEPVQLTENLKVVSVGFLLDSPKDPVIWRGPMKFNAIRQFLKDVNWGELDFLVIDSPPGTGDEPLAVAQMIGPGSQAVIVTTPQDVAINDVRRSITFCHKVSLPVVGIIENMSGLICPDCGKRVDLFKSGGGEKLAEEMDIAFLGRIPLDPQIVHSGDHGRPFVHAFAESNAAKAFAEAIEPILNPSPSKKAESDSQKSEKTPTKKPSVTENSKMKIAIPVAGGQICMHFGHCEQFALVEVDTEAKSIVSTDYLNPPAHEPGVLPRWLHEQGANIILAGGMGQRAQSLFTQNEIQVVVGITGGTPEEIVTAFLNENLETGDNVCDH